MRNRLAYPGNRPLDIGYSLAAFHAHVTRDGLRTGINLVRPALQKSGLPRLPQRVKHPVQATYEAAPPQADPRAEACSDPEGCTGPSC